MEPKQITKEWLREAYATRTVKEIAKELGVTSPTVYRLLSDAGIPRKGKQKVVIVDAVL